MSTSEVWGLVTRGKGAILTSRNTLDKRNRNAIDQGDTSYCKVKMLPGQIGSSTNIGLVMQKGAPYQERVNDM